MGVLRPKISPLVQSGDMSHPTKRIIGDIMAESTARIMLIVSIILLYISTDALEVVSSFFGSDAGVGSLGVFHAIQKLAASAYSIDSYDIVALLVRASCVSICIFQKNPPRAMSERIEYVRMRLRYIGGTIMNIASLDHNLYFFANIRDFFLLFR